MYDTLRPELMTTTDEIREKMRSCPEYVVDIENFKISPIPFYEQKRKWLLEQETLKRSPTLTHRYVNEILK